jgi:hypothetical protein
VSDESRSLKRENDLSPTNASETLTAQLSSAAKSQRQRKGIRHDDTRNLISIRRQP